MIKSLRGQDLPLLEFSCHLNLLQSLVLGPLACPRILEDAAVCVNRGRRLSVLIHTELLPRFLCNVAAVRQVLHRGLSDQLFALTWLHRLAVDFLAPQRHRVDHVLLAHRFHGALILLRGRAFKSFIRAYHEESSHVPVIVVEQIYFRIVDSGLLALTKSAGKLNVTASVQEVCFSIID